MGSDPTLRFSSRVENYVRYRPDYPPEVLGVMCSVCGFTPDASVADIGSGTGIFSELLLRNGNRVSGVEPNAEMRAAAERLLAGNTRFVSVDGTAEATTLSDHSVGVITAAQAFHWFDRERTHREFARILQPGGWVVLIWNVRRVDSTPFLRAYEDLLVAFGTDYTEVRDRHPDLPRVQEFIGSDRVIFRSLEHRQWFDDTALLGRLLSSSYAPETGNSKHAPMRVRLAEIFREHQTGGRVSFDYDTQIYCAQLAAG